MRVPDAATRNAPGRQHIEPTARGRASRPRLHKATVERALMDRFRDRALREPENAPPATLPRLLALALSLALVAAMLLGFDTFLTAVQKFMEVEVVDPAPAATDPMPLKYRSDNQ